MCEIFSSTIAVCLLLCQFGAAQAESIQERFRRVKSSVVVVQTTQKVIAAFPQHGDVNLPGLGSGVLFSAEVMHGTVGKDDKDRRIGNE